MLGIFVTVNCLHHACTYIIELLEKGRDREMPSKLYKWGPGMKWFKLHYEFLVDLVVDRYSTNYKEDEKELTHVWDRTQDL